MTALQSRFWGLHNCVAKGSASLRYAVSVGSWKKIFLRHFYPWRWRHYIAFKYGVMAQKNSFLSRSVICLDIWMCFMYVFCSLLVRLQVHNASLCVCIIKTWKLWSSICTLRSIAWYHSMFLQFHNILFFITAQATCNVVMFFTTGNWDWNLPDMLALSLGLQRQALHRHSKNLFCYTHLSTEGTGSWVDEIGPDLDACT